MMDVRPLETAIGKAAISIRARSSDEGIMALALDLAKAAKEAAAKCPPDSRAIEPLYKALIGNPELAKKAGVEVYHYPLEAGAKEGQAFNAFTAMITAGKSDIMPILIHEDHRTNTAHIFVFSDGLNLVREIVTGGTIRELAQATTQRH